MTYAIIDNSGSVSICVIGIGLQGLQAIAYLRQQPWWRYICQQSDFQNSPFKYIVADNKPIDSNMAMTGAQATENSLPPLFYVDGSNQQALVQWCGDLTYIISGLEVDSVSNLFAEIAGYFSGSVLVSVITEPAAELELSAFQQRINRIKPVAGCVIVNSANHIRLQAGESWQTNNMALYWDYQYQAACDILCGITSLLHIGLIGRDFADLRTILQPGRKAKAVYLNVADADWPHRAMEKAVFLLNQEGLDLADSDLRACLGNFISDGHMDLLQFDLGAAALSKLIPNDIDKVYLTRANETMKANQLGLFILAIKDENLKCGNSK